MYHVTYFKNLPSIMSGGLSPQRSSNFGGSYAQHSKGRLFFTEKAGISFWMHKLHDHAENRYDDAYLEEMFPVVLKVSGLRHLEEDPVGTKDARHQAFMGSDPVPATAIQVWTGTAWKPLSNRALGDIETYLSSRVEVEEEDGEILYWYDPDLLFPR